MATLLASAALLNGCLSAPASSDVPTRVPTANALATVGPEADAAGSSVPSTWTPTASETPLTPTPDVATLRLAAAQAQAEAAASMVADGSQSAATAPATTPQRQIIPTNTPTPTPSNTPTPTATPITGPDIRPLDQYALTDVIPLEAFPRPPGDNGWGMHWIPTVSQEPAVVDRFVNELVRMHIKWVVFLNDGTNIGTNDYLVDRLVGAGIMPVMRVFRSNLLPYDGDLGKMVAHYRQRGVYYYQLYNEPNANVENDQGFSNPTRYALTWASAAREVIANGGLPGLGALSPGGAYNHYAFLERTLLALQRHGDGDLLNHTWLAVHNYHGLRPLDDPNGFLLFRRYDEIVRTQLGRSLPMIGTEGGSYSPNPQVEADLLAWQYGYMREAEPYFFAFSHWLLANLEGGSADSTWEWQTLFRDGFVHPLVTEFFYHNRR
ncbi:MAG: hypothetical protein R3300_06410 [Candidatus Promineifilaceae bacterium]|nr:hypothetical protein [Candidatus Promineifilaceae bacterium]